MTAPDGGRLLLTVGFRNRYRFAPEHRALPNRLWSIRRRMRILLTEENSAVGAGLCQALSGTHQIHSLPAGTRLTDAEAMWAQLRGIDAVIHTGVPLNPAATGSGAEAERAALEEATQGMHVLLEALTQANIRRFIYCSTLELFENMPDDRYICEQWRPDPGTDMRTLSRHLAEQVAREFARDRALSVTILRLGRLTREEDVIPGQEPDLMWLDPRDAVRAIASAVEVDRSQQLNWQSRWAVFHICARPPHPKFLLDGSRSLAFEPEHNFASAWSAAGAA